MRAETDGKVKYKRVLLKISGEALMGDQGFGLHPPTVARIAREVKSGHDMGVEICMVIGGGNIFRGLSGAAQGMERTTADYMGMLATVINAIALQNALEKLGIPTRVQTAIEMHEVAEPFIHRKAMRHLEKGRVVIFAAGTGNPYFSTDTAAALRASEIGANVLIKATKVDGIYTEDPHKNPNAKKFGKLTFREALATSIRVMDSAAFALCMENDIPIMVLDFFEDESLERAIRGEDVGTLVTN